MADESIFVNDGCTLQGSWPAVPGLYPAGTFTYRPATDAVRSEYQEAARGGRGLEVGRRITARQIRELCVGDAPGARLTAEQVGQLHAGIADALLNAALGLSSPVVVNEGNSPGPSGSS